MSEATDMVVLYVAAEKAVLNGQAYTIAGRSMTRANLSEIRTGRKEWQAIVRTENATSNGGSPHYSVADFT